MKINNSLLYFVVGILLIGTGVFMLSFDIVKIGTHYLTHQRGVIGGAIIVFLGIIGVFLGYSNLSPFGKFRSFFEGRTKSKRKK